MCLKKEILQLLGNQEIFARNFSQKKNNTIKDFQSNIHTFSIIGKEKNTFKRKIKESFNI